MSDPCGICGMDGDDPDHSSQPHVFEPERRGRVEVRLVFVHMTGEGSETYEAAFVQIDDDGTERWGHELIVHPDRAREVVAP